MWRRVEIEARLDHPPERVFPYLANPARWHEFAPAVFLRRQIGEEPLGVGTRWAAIDRIGPFKVHFTDELVELDTNRRVVWDSTTPWNSRVEYVCVPETAGTRVLARYEGDVAGWLRLVALLPTFVLARILERDFKGLRSRLAAEHGAEGYRSRSAPSARAAWAAARRATGTRNGEQET
jgi:uncharacterized protein YndB with AHSA1/START domain